MDLALTVKEDIPYGTEYCIDHCKMFCIIFFIGDLSKNKSCDLSALYVSVELGLSLTGNNVQLFEFKTRS
jgi:hypothetical protein